MQKRDEPKCGGGAAFKIARSFSLYSGPNVSANRGEHAESFAPVSQNIKKI